MWLVFRDGTELVGFVWFGFSHAVARYTGMGCRVTVPFILFYLVFTCLLGLGIESPLLRGKHVQWERPVVPVFTDGD